jgi:hypothetical protein
VHAHALIIDERQARLAQRDDVVYIEVRLHDPASGVRQPQGVTHLVNDGDPDEMPASKRGDQRVGTAARPELQSSHLLVDDRQVDEHDRQTSARLTHHVATDVSAVRSRRWDQAHIDREGAVGGRGAVRASVTVVPREREPRRLEQRSRHVSSEVEIRSRDLCMPNDLGVQGHVAEGRARGRRQHAGQDQSHHGGNPGRQPRPGPDLYGALRRKLGRESRGTAGPL